jgi:hypothetical protein
VAVVTYAGLLGASPGYWTVVATYVRAAAADAGDRFDDATAVEIRLAAAWRGAAAEAARARLHAVRGRLAAAYATLTGLDQVLAEYGESLRLARDRLIAAAPAHWSAIVVEPDGRVVDESGGLWEPEAVSVRRAIDDALADADRVGIEAARRLDAVAAAFTVPPEPGPPPPGPPHSRWSTVKWWTGLTPAEQLYAITASPGLLSTLDGLPADARDTAARLWLREQRSALRVQRTIVVGQAAAHADAPGTLDTITARLAGLDGILARLDNPNRPRAYLLAVDATRDSAIVAIGDPDRATDVLTFVPGVGSDLDGSGPTIAAADAITAAADNLSGTAGVPAGHDLSTIGWLDYAAPPTVVAAATRAPAQAAAYPLLAFTDDDCRVDPGWIAALIEPLLAGNASAVVVRRPGRPY